MTRLLETEHAYSADWDESETWHARSLAAERKLAALLVYLDEPGNIREASLRAILTGD
jgi:hypothetical protein